MSPNGFGVKEVRLRRILTERSEAVCPLLGEDGAVIMYQLLSQKSVKDSFARI